MGGSVPPVLYMRGKFSYMKGGFSIIEFLLVLTAFVVFLGAAFIGYRTIKANANENKIAIRVELFAKGIKEYAKDFGAYPFITCANATDWNTAASSNNIASCSALMSYIGHWLGDTNVGQPWQYYAWASNYSISGCNGTGTSCNESATQGFYAIETPPIDNAYAQAVINILNQSGLTCYSNTFAYAPSGSTSIDCSGYFSDNVYLSPTSPKF